MGMRIDDVFDPAAPLPMSVLWWAKMLSQSREAAREGRALLATIRRVTQKPILRVHQRNGPK
jgi:hypothetical protein